jgi:hypothetical protein
MKNTTQQGRKKLHLHALPVVVTLLALTFLVGGMLALAGNNAASQQLGRALVRKGVTLTSTSDGSVHFGLARASAPAPLPTSVLQPIADAQIGLSSSLQQTVDQTVTNTSY